MNLPRLAPSTVLGTYRVVVREAAPIVQTPYGIPEKRRPIVAVKNLVLRASDFLRPSNGGPALAVLFDLVAIPERAAYDIRTSYVAGPDALDFDAIPQLPGNGHGVYAKGQVLAVTMRVELSRAEYTVLVGASE